MCVDTLHKGENDDDDDDDYYNNNNNNNICRNSQQLQPSQHYDREAPELC
jgi:hypothetical protein